MRVTCAGPRKACRPQLEAGFQMTVPEEGDSKPLVPSHVPSSPCVSIRAPAPHRWTLPSAPAPGHFLCFAGGGTVRCPLRAGPRG